VVVASCLAAHSQWLICIFNKPALFLKDKINSVEQLLLQSSLWDQTEARLHPRPPPWSPFPAASGRGWWSFFWEPVFAKLCAYESLSLVSVSREPKTSVLAVCSWLRVKAQARRWWLLPIILATQEAKIGRVAIPGKPRQKVYKTVSQPMAGHNSVHLLSQLHRRLRSGGWWFQASLSKNIHEHHLSGKGWV
jgi:hypothetical protein